MVKQGLYKQLTLDPDWVSSEVDRLLAEDLAGGDVTTDAVVPSDLRATARIEAAEELVFAGAVVIPPIFKNLCAVDLRISDGQQVAAGEIIGTLSGSARPILSRERVMLNLLQHLSGIATLTRLFVDKAAPYGVIILDTRKTIPGLRRFEKYAVALGGGTNHRLDLSEGVLVKDNHLAVGGNLIEMIRSLRQEGLDLPIEVEADTGAQVRVAMEAGVDALLLDNMSVEEVRACVDIVRGHPAGDDIFIEASGGIRLTNVEAYAQTGVDGLSIGYLTHSAPAVDIRLELEP
ncbi:MAG: carboxylating nicotinate-nucleotide diphosphorylase [Fidelibacterota bacterium]|nr:MAG: carboxylating nicotinate-nucleotide diphosphorylase [Candidatus Neomarinimicrobiota bacterium]